MGAAIRYPIAIVLAAIVTFALFFLMQLLIAMGSGDLKKGESSKIADIHMPEREMELIAEEVKPEKAPEPEAPPPDLAPPPMDVSTPDTGISLSLSLIHI